VLKQRIITALILIPVFVWIILSLDTPVLAGVMAAVVLLGAWEWTTFFNWRRLMRVVYLAVTGILLVGGYFLATRASGLFALMALVMVWWCVAAGWVLRYRKGRPAAASGKAANEYRPLSQRPAFALLTGNLLLVPTFIAVVAIHANPQLGPKYVLFVLSLMWVADSAAYFTGRRWGRSKLAPWVSPGKSWEGVGGALVFSAMWALLWTTMFGLDFLATDLFLVLSIVTVVFSIVGDLFESLFKRLAHIKDSSHLLPGHGGILDRIDSIIAGAPVFLFGLLVLAR
jgi:phosphatidate cytidylyltransferase